MSPPPRPLVCFSETAHETKIGGMHRQHREIYLVGRPRAGDLHQIVVGKLVYELSERLAIQSKYPHGLAAAHIVRPPSQHLEQPHRVGIERRGAAIGAPSFACVSM